MNEQQPYEKHLAEKFKQLPLPDVEPNWQRMKLLLDKEMPRGGGYWRWVTAVGILLFMLGGTWLFISQKDTTGLAASKVKKAQDTSVQTTRQTQDQSSSDKQTTVTPIITPGIEKNLHDNSSETASTPKPGPTSLSVKNQSTSTSNNNESNKSSVEEPRVDEPVSPGKEAPGKGNQVAANNGTRTGDVNEHPGASTKSKNDGGITIPRNNNSRNRGNRDREALGTGEKDLAQQPLAQDEIKYSTVDYNIQNFYSGIPLEKLAVDSIAQGYSRLMPESTKIVKNAGGAKAKSARPSAIESVQDRTLAFGFSLPLGFPLGDQKPGAYNINAKPNTISDFIPVPHMQYHVNNKVYLQTELQFMNPQFIQPVLLFQNKTEYASTNTVHYNSVYARKLYYFNVPVGIHYSPFPHFYLGTGLQFSSLVSGVALREETSSTIGSASSTLISQQYSKFKNDTLANRIDNSEFRLMLDANYYWKQFTVGLRYNQALSNYVNFRLNTVSPLFTDKNKSLQFYLRYNLWEDYKKKK